VTGPVLHEDDPLPQPRRVEPGPAGHDADQDLQKPDVLPLVLAADVVPLPGRAGPQDRPDGAVVVLHVDPVADVPAVAVDRERLALDHVEDHERQEFLGELVGAVVVRAI